MRREGRRAKLTGLSPARSLAAGGLALVTVAVLLWQGLSVTSGAIELATFAVALAAWVVGAPERADPAGPVARDVRSRAGGVRVEQAGPAPLAERIDAAGDADVRQRSSDR